MDRDRRLTAESAIEDDILATSHSRRRVMFSDLADALPQHTWQKLFSALGRLSRTGAVTLSPHRWDYEVVFLEAPRSSSHSRLMHARVESRPATVRPVASVGRFFRIVGLRQA